MYIIHCMPALSHSIGSRRHGGYFNFIVNLTGIAGITAQIQWSKDGRFVQRESCPDGGPFAFQFNCRKEHQVRQFRFHHIRFSLCVGIFLTVPKGIRFPGNHFTAIQQYHTCIRHFLCIFPDFTAVSSFGIQFPFVLLSSILRGTGDNRLGTLTISRIGHAILHIQCAIPDIAPLKEHHIPVFQICLFHLLQGCPGCFRSKAVITVIAAVGNVVSVSGVCLAQDQVFPLGNCRRTVQNGLSGMPGISQQRIFPIRCGYTKAAAVHNLKGKFQFSSCRNSLPTCQRMIKSGIRITVLKERFRICQRRL